MLTVSSCFKSRDFDVVTLLHTQFEDAFNQPDPLEALTKLMDPGLGDDYPLDSVRKVV